MFLTFQVDMIRWRHNGRTFLTHTTSLGAIMTSSGPIVFTGNANPELARQIAAQLGHPLGRVKVRTFDDGEARISFDENVRGRHVFIVQPTNQPDRNLTEIELMVRAIRSSADHITVVVPYLGYARQDRKTEPREPISVVQRLRNLISSGLDGLVLHDLHSAMLTGICEAIDPRLRVDHTYSRPVFLDWLSRQDLSNATISSIDAGGAKMVESYWTRLRKMGFPVEFGFAHKSGTSSVGISGTKLLGEYAGRHVYFVDDMITSGRSATEGAAEAKRLGATQVTFVASHAVMANIGVAHRVADSAIDRFVVTNTIAVKPEHRVILGNKLVEVGIDSFLALVIKHLDERQSLSALFELDGYREALPELQAAT